jgi:sugar phosphate isomerase/epimerase
VIAMDDRLGLNLHRDAWPTPRLLAAHEEAGFRWLQVHTPPRAMLADRARCRRHARALRSVLDAIRERALLEERSLVRFLRRAHTLGITIAIENLAPVHPGPARLCHDPLAVRDLVRRLDSPAAGMLLDVGHLHVTAEASHSDPGAIAAAVAPDVALFHVHDNFGVRRHDLDAPGIDPLKLDLHLPPGRGCVPWARLAPALGDHHAPLMLEIEPSQRPSLPELAACALGALATRPERAAA